MAKKKKEVTAKPATKTNRKAVSVLDKQEKRLLDLATGKKPRSREEAEMQKEIDEMVKRGIMIEIPSN